MKVKRIVHSILCLVLCCCILLHSMPVKADATAAGAAGLITSAAGVSVAAPLAIAASLIALGVMAKNTNPLVFENTVNDAVASLSAAGTWVKHGAVELLQTVNSAGEKAYYVAGDMLEDLRSYLFDSNTIFYEDVKPPLELSSNAQKAWNACLTHPYSCQFYDASGLWRVAYSNYPIIHILNDGEPYLTTTNGYLDLCVWSSSYGWQSCFGVYTGGGSVLSLTESGSIVQVPSTSFDLSLGSIPYAGSFTGGTVTDNTFLDFLSKRIRFQNSTDPDNDGSDEDNYNWMVPLALGAAGTVYAMTQIEQWTGTTPSDFEDYKVVDEMTIVSTPTIGGYPGIIATPKIDFPSQGEDKPFVPEIPQIGGGSTTITPAEGLNGTLSETGAHTFLDSIGTFFGAWFDSILKWLESLWELISSGVISLLDAIKALPAAIADAISSVLTKLFAISDTFIATKVEALALKYPYLDTFRVFGANLKGYLSGIGSTPPVIYINLGAASGSYEYGGTMPFLDLTWYSQYKPTMDAILGGFLWLWLAWRLYLAAPGIISGASGTWGSIASLRERRKEDKE